jgi:hypothetical protein
MAARIALEVDDPRRLDPAMALNVKLENIPLSRHNGPMAAWPSDPPGRPHRRHRGGLSDPQQAALGPGRAKPMFMSGQAAALIMAAIIIAYGLAMSG